MSSGTRYMAPPKDYRPPELLDGPWIDVVSFVVYPALVVALLLAALAFALIRLHRRRRAQSHG